MLLDADDNVKLADFGLSTIIRLRNGQTMSTFSGSSNGIKGTYAFMAPEVAQSKQFSRKSDVW